MPKQMVSKYGGTCVRCWRPIEVDTTIEYDSSTKTATHVGCEPQEKPEPTGELKEALDYLNGLKHRTDFQESLLEQYGRKGFLTDKQVASCLNQKVENLPSPDVVPAGRYALPVPSQHIEALGEHLFFKVWRAPANPNIVRCYQLHVRDEVNWDTTVDDRETRIDSAKVMEAIVKFGVADAAILYGNRRGRCSHCDQPLRNALSRKLRVGPVCIKGLYDEMEVTMRKYSARSWLRHHNIDPAGDLPLDFDLVALEKADDELAKQAFSEVEV